MAESAAARRTRERKEADEATARLETDGAPPARETEQRVERAQATEKLETRPANPGIKSATADQSGYSAEAEIRKQWPLAFEDKD